MAEKLLTIFFEEFSKFELFHFVISLLKYGRIFKIKILDPQFFVFSSNLHQLVVRRLGHLTLDRERGVQFPCADHFFSSLETCFYSVANTYSLPFLKWGLSSL